MTASSSKSRKPVPFDSARLDKLLDQAGIDVLVATSKHNVQYLLGGYRFFFFDSMDAIGVSRYLPVVIYQKGKLENAAYIGNAMENHEEELGRFWTPTVKVQSWGTQDAMQLAAEHIKKLGGVRRVGVETAFLPADADRELRSALGNVELVDALFPLERLRAIKSPAEIEMLRQASERVVDSMLATLRDCAPGKTKHEFVETLRREEVNRGLGFDYCLITAGASHNRAPSDVVLKSGDVMSIDSGGNFHGYIGDLARMGIIGEPDSELEELLGHVEEVQQAARKPIRPGTRGGDIYTSVEEPLRRSSHHPYVHFMAHGMGLVSHEAPRLSGTNPVPYPGHDENLPLERGMVISVETTMSHPRRGYIKIEDTIVVTDNGHESLGDGGRGWNRAG
jgi:Xaa-Pro aminopeptidase